LLACCREIPRQHQRPPLSQVDWQRFLTMMDHHGVAAQISEALQPYEGQIPPEALRAIRESCRSNTRGALWLSSELARILQHLAARNIPTLPYKGPTLAQFLYGDLARRQFSDLDILVHAGDVKRVCGALAEIGFTAGTVLRPREEQALLQSGYELTFDSTHGRNLLEIQWQILPRFYAVDFEMEGIFERSVPQEFAGGSIRSLCPEDLLLVLAVHAAKHLWIQLSWLCDLATLARSPQIHWERVVRDAKQLGIMRILLTSFELAHQLLGTSRPSGLAGDEQVEALVARLRPLIERGETFDTESLPYFQTIAASRERRSDRLRFWWRLATTPSVGEWSAVYLPGPLFPFYHAVRAARLAKRALLG